jgi:hypothetical protein
VPTGHGVGADEFNGQKFPRPHATAGAEVLGQNVPGRQGYEKFQTRSTLDEKPYKIRDDVTIGRPSAYGTNTEFPISDKFDTSTICMTLLPELVTKSARLSGEIPRLHVLR